MGKETLLVRRLLSQGYEVFYPLRISRNGKSHKASRQAFFPGYIFIRLDLSRNIHSIFQHMPYCEGLVSFGQKPAFVPDELVAAIQRRADGTNPDEQGEGGRGVAVSRGAILDERLSSAERVRELMTLLQGMSLSPASEP